MTFLPIVGRELRVAARRKETYRARALVAGTVVALSALVFLLSSNDNPQEIGTRLFTVASGGLLAWCLFAGAALTADCLSEEKREGTLGLLFLTDLKGYDVVLGKLATTSVNALYSLLAALPVLALPLLLGGVSPGEWGRMALVCLNAMFLSLTIGLAAGSHEHVQVTCAVEVGIEGWKLPLAVFQQIPVPAVRGEIGQGDPHARLGVGRVFHA